MAEDAAALSVEVAWIGVEPPLRVALAVAPGTTVAGAIDASGIVARIAAAAPPPPGQGPLDGLGIAVHGRPAAPGDRLHDHDRVELLPALTVDPKVARARRAEHRRRQTGERRWAPDQERPKPPSAD
ncbi:MAG: RnfH family protein [Burkholderiales bacterium]|jgi:putative ubiquitin-RnfH superfamily antitoxin RatB of RatAB toxin-antitoxin module|nr:RnfH family protein [Burkholderiales bacterium]MCZ8105077.1 RnfH family protein [Burkholderiales bacterium]MCZ8320083.1 RnfH family protein [Novosphingobium sp.]